MRFIEYLNESNSDIKFTNYKKGDLLSIELEDGKEIVLSPQFELVVKKEDDDFIFLEDGEEIKTLKLSAAKKKIGEIETVLNILKAFKINLATNDGKFRKGYIDFFSNGNSPFTSDKAFEKKGIVKLEVAFNNISMYSRRPPYHTIAIDGDKVTIEINDEFDTESGEHVFTTNSADIVAKLKEIKSGLTKKK